MSSSYIPRALRRQIIRDFSGRCAYCQTATEITGARLVIEHILPESVGGMTEQGNLCLACHSCNEFKGAKTTDIDPETGESVALFHPRRQQWSVHFRWSEDGALLFGLTPTGRATVQALNLNHFEIVEARRRWVQIGWHPPTPESQ